MKRGNIRRWLGLILFVFLWELCAGFVKQRVFPPPSQIVLALYHHWASLGVHCGHSVFRLVSGVLLSLLAGMPLGLLLGYYKWADQVFSPTVYTLAPIPKVALLPLLMLAFGIGNFSKIFMIFIIMVFQVIVAVRDAVRELPEEYFLPYRAAGAGNSFILRHIVVPASIPAMFTALRIGLSTSISVLFFSETFGTTWGLGFYIMDMWMRLDYVQMYLGICTLGGIGLISTVLVDTLERICCVWKPKNN